MAGALSTMAERDLVSLLQRVQQAKQMAEQQATNYGSPSGILVEPEVVRWMAEVVLAQADRKLAELTRP